MNKLAPLVLSVDFRLEDSISQMAKKAIATIPGKSAAAVIGFSMGGMVAMEIARQAPQRISKLALLNSNFHADLADRRATRAQHLEQTASMSMGNVIRQFYLERYLHQPSLRAEELIINMATELGTACFKAQIKALSTRQASGATLKRIHKPALILGGNQDSVCPPEIQARMHQMIEGSELVMLDDCGHFSMLEKPQDVNDALRNWYLSDE
ncbi:unnamed protein product [marine sediment metagenome]|uniref:AB hydrolase-1 domain-containing protein n=1 Tax=marine sediment metagenome TaxID=412755 RepID=X1BL62_9ZZZZ